MIISVSRRTDIPAYYSRWFMNRIRDGYCHVPNPYRMSQVARVSLLPKDVDVIVFWTRNPRPLFPHLSELDQRGYRYYFQYTVLNNPRLLDWHSPPMDAAVKTFQALSDRVGSERVIWRYDPIIFSEQTGTQFHVESYGHIAKALQGYTGRSVISVLDIYGKVKTRLDALRGKGLEVVDYQGKPSPRFDEMIQTMATIAQSRGMEIVSCAEKLGLESLGIRPGKCVDDDYIKAVFDIEVGGKKDPGQRAACGCVVSKDIGMYDSCLFGCQYCYATNSFERARINYNEHDPNSPSLIGRVGIEEVA